jgi:hypothetical protein
MSLSRWDSDAGANRQRRTTMSEERKRVEVGLVYSGRVGGAFVPVRLDANLGHGRYEATVLPGGTPVKISTDAIRGEGKTEEDWKASRTPKMNDLPPVPESPPSTPDARRSRKKEPGEKKPSGLDAAARVLREEGKPMKIGDVVRVAIEKGYWQSSGKTPEATVYAAIIREIATKGTDARFTRAEVTTTTDGQTKTERAFFELTAAGKEAA